MRRLLTMAITGLLIVGCTSLNYNRATVEPSRGTQIYLYEEQPWMDDENVQRV